MPGPLSCLQVDVLLQLLSHGLNWCLQICYLSFLSATAFLHPSKSSQEGANLFLLEIFFTALIAIFAGFGKVGVSLRLFALCVLCWQVRLELGGCSWEDAAMSSVSCSDQLAPDHLTSASASQALLLAA